MSESEAGKIQEAGNTPEDRFIPIKEYCQKYGFLYAHLIRAVGKEQFIAEKRSVYDPETKRRGKRWFLYDVPPEEHPDYKPKKFKPITQRAKEYRKSAARKFAELAPIYIKKFNEQAHPGQSSFSQSELARVLDTNVGTIEKWALDGVEGFGHLPRMNVPEDVQVKYSDRTYFYHRKDIVDFFLGNCVPGKRRKKTLDDSLIERDESALAREHGYYVYDPNKAYPLSYEGFIKWVEENVYRFDRNQMKWVPFVPIQIQRDFYKKVFELDKNENLRHQFIRVSRPRGDFKSFDTCLIFLFRFFNLAHERIILAANSREQSDFVLFNEAKAIIYNSPNLAALADTPGLEIKDKEIVLMSGRKNVFARIQAIASQHGTMSNATCICFSEIYKCQNENFVVELEGSIRGVPNAQSIIESTVAPMGHYFHRQFEIHQKGEDSLMYFQHYDSKHYNPDITPAFLESRRRAMKPNDFRRFFVNRWEDAAYGLFTPQNVLEMSYYGIDGDTGPSQRLSINLKKLLDLQNRLNTLNAVRDVENIRREIKSIEKHLMKVDDLYKMPATRADIDKLEDLFGCQFIITAGLDRAKQLSAKSDRTCLFFLARGVLDEFRSIFFVLDVYLPPESSMKLLTDRVLQAANEWGWIDAMDLEEYQAYDLQKWFEDAGIESRLVPGSYKHQDEMFDYLYTHITKGWFKCPRVPYWFDEENKVYNETPPEGGVDIFRAEMREFEHDPQKKYFGSPYKRTTGHSMMGKPKDDTVYAAAHALCASLRGDLIAGNKDQYGMMEALENEDVVGRY